MLSKEMQQYIQVNRETKNATKDAVFTPELVLGARAAVDQMLGAIPVPEEITVSEEAINGVKGEMYHYCKERPESLNHKIVLFMHGGGFATGSVASRRYMCVNTLKYAKMDGYSAEYTQFPEGNFVESLTDAIRVFKGLQEKGYDPADIYLMGESAGAMLCLALTHWLKDNKKALPGKVCLYSPVTNLITENPSRKERDERDPIIQGFINEQMNFFFTEFDKQSRYVSTITADYEGFPELMVNVGTEEVLWDDSIQLVDKAEKAGVKVQLKVWDELFHVFPMFPAPESETAMAFNAAFLSGNK